MVLKVTAVAATCHEQHFCLGLLLLQRCNDVLVEYQRYSSCFTHLSHICIPHKGFPCAAGYKS